MEENKEVAQSKNPIKILWLAFVGAVFVYFVVGYLRLSEKKQSLEINFDELWSGLFLVATALACLLFFGAYVYLPKLLKAEDEKKKTERIVLQFACLEVIGLLGVGLAFLTGSFTQLLVFCLWAFLALVGLFLKKD